MKTGFKICVLSIFVLAACQKEDRFNQINGFVQKGPFISGTTIMIQELDAGFNPSGKSFSLMTNDDFGSFVLQSEITSEFVEIIASGYYFNEISGRISDGPLTLRAISSLKNDKTSNVNILTTLARNRILYLIKNQNKSFREAKKESESEILDFFKISMDNINFNELDISKNGLPNAVLLAISAIMQGEHSVGELSEFISKFNLDFEPDGVIQSQDIINTVINNAANVDINLVYANLAKRYSDLSLNVNIPPFELFVKKLCPLMVVQTIPADNETEVTYDIDAIKITFNKSINHAVGSDVQLKDEQNNVVPISFAYDPSIYQLTLIPEIELLPEKLYSVILDSQVQATDGDQLDGGYTFSFKTVNIDILSNLSAHYLFNGNTEDSSGNDNHAFLNGGRFTKGRDGTENTAIEFLRKGDYLQMPGFDLSTNGWTYSLWIYMSQYPQFAGSLLATNMSSGSFWENPFYVGGISKCLFSYNDHKNPKDANNILELNKWIHVAMVIDHQNVKFYINGQKTYEMSDYSYRGLEYCFKPFDNRYDGHLYISEKQFWDDHTEFIGVVDNVRFYQRALNKFEIKQIFDSE